MRLVLFMFAGRRENMEVQMPYLRRILSMYPQAELHLWDLTRDAADQRYLDTLQGAEDGRVQVLRHFHEGHPIMCLYPGGATRRRGHPRCTCLVHKPPYEKPYAYYAEKVDSGYANAVFVKIDDDVLFLETERFADLIDPVIAHPERIVSASVVNNAVCAKYRRDRMVTANHFAVGDPGLPRNDQRWWALHEKPEFARWCHKRFIADVYSGLLTLSKRDPLYIRTRPGEAVSINCIAFSHQTMRKLAGMMSDRLGDEGAVDRLLPWIALSFTAAHLSFGPQDRGMDKVELDSLRDQYRQLSTAYLA